MGEQHVSSWFPVEQRSPSSQSIGSLRQLPPEQLSVVQALPSSQSTGAFEQLPLSQTSVVQASPSSQSSGSFTQPLSGSQLSVVQPSRQEMR